MPLDDTELGGTPDELDTLKLDVGDTYVGTIIDISAAPHYVFGTAEPKYDRAGQPMTKWVVRLRPDGATTPDSDVKFWAQSQVKFELRATIAQHPHNYPGGKLKIERLEDGEPRQKGYRGPANYQFTYKPGPDRWTDPLAAPVPDIDNLDDPF